MRSLADLTNEKFGAASQKILISNVVNMIRKFMIENKLNEDSLMGSEVLPLITSIEGFLATAKLRADSQLLTIFANLRVGLELVSQMKDSLDADSPRMYDTAKLVKIMKRK